MHDEMLTETISEALSQQSDEMQNIEAVEQDESTEDTEDAEDTEDPEDTEDAKTTDISKNVEISASEIAEQSEQSAPGDELTALRAELDELRSQLRERDAAMQRMSEEVAEFSELYPERSLSLLPAEVWESVRAGIPLAAAVAFFEAKQRRRAQLAAEVNERNRSTSSGGIDGVPPDYFSPTEVRAMSAAEVRLNYSKILDSMKMWS